MSELAEAITDMFPEVSACEDNDKRYSTHELMALAQSYTGVRFDQWHLDVAADAESHWAPRWFAAVETPGCAGVNALIQSWLPAPDYEGPWNIWANIPFSDPPPWFEKAWATAIEAHRWKCDPVLCLVFPSDRTDKHYWQEMIEPFRDGRKNKARWRPEQPDDRCRTFTLDLEVINLPGRIRYGCPGNPRAAGVGQPMFGTSLLVWSR